MVHKVGSVDPKGSVTSLQGIHGYISVMVTSHFSSLGKDTKLE